MDDFIAELERSISKLGAEKIWKRQIGETEIWFSPISLYAQEKISEMMNNSESLGINIVHETKRITLSFAISGINGTDLRPYRDIAPSFPTVGKDGRTTKVTLDKYLYTKMIGWSAQFIDDAFTVYTDLIESHQKENLANIKFENQKSPEEELSELESRAAEIREALGKPKLVEERVVEPVASKPVESVPNIQTPGPVVTTEFDPFAKIANSFTPPAPSAVAPIVPPSEKIEVLESADSELFTNPVTTRPQSPIRTDVIDQRMTTASVPPSINDPALNRNPRFNPPQR
jgi:hypothetical protein